MTPMQLGVETETEIFLLACFGGVLLGAVYDLLRAFRETLRHALWIIFAEDFLYALLFGAVYFIFSQAQAGQLRLFVLVGMTLGAAMERIALGNFTVWIIGRLMRLITQFFTAPLMGIVHKLTGKIRAAFVGNRPKFKKDKKKKKKVLQV